MNFSQLLLSLSLAVVIPSPAMAQDFWTMYYAKYNAPLTTCQMQSQCVKYTITENETPTKCGSPCEYRVCWNQATPGEGWNNAHGWWGFLSACMRLEHVDFIGDMHTSATSNDPFDQCLNDDNTGGKGYWDSTCTDPQQAFGNSYTFANVCQNVPAGQTVHFLMSDGGSCSGGATKAEMTGYGTHASCAPSTQDLAGSNPGGQTFFPAYGGGPGGTCSGQAEGSECVWSVTVPSTCSYEEGDPCKGDEAVRNEETICPDDDGSALVYYQNDRNGDPPVTPIHDIQHNGDGTVSFRVMNPFGDDLSNIYTVMPEPGGHGDAICPKQNSATDCITDEVYTAQCIDDEAWTFVTVFVVGEDDNSAAAQLVDTVNGSQGTDVYECCPKTFEPNGRFGAQQTAAFSYLIHCECEASAGGARALRVSNGLAEQFGGHGASLSRKDLEDKFLRGELFDDELKKLYGLL
mmetsp:Transcript_18981/g.47019  ORF Transcript_18981/g.47019 Transcript_18981/m.47019 type:complete len:461 (-) Transcript_18981:444-1826(-)